MKTNANNNDRSITKHIKIQISGDADAVNTAIALLHHLNFINGSVWSNAIRKRGEGAIVRVAAREVRIENLRSENLEWRKVERNSSFFILTSPKPSSPLPQPTPAHRSKQNDRWILLQFELHFQKAFEILNASLRAIGLRLLMESIASTVRV
jgi:hypothetical protein